MTAAVELPPTLSHWLSRTQHSAHRQPQHVQDGSTVGRTGVGAEGGGLRSDCDMRTAGCAAQWRCEDHQRQLHLTPCEIQPSHDWVDMRSILFAFMIGGYYTRSKPVAQSSGLSRTLCRTSVNQAVSFDRPLFATLNARFHG